MSNAGQDLGLEWMADQVDCVVDKELRDSMSVWADNDIFRIVVLPDRSERHAKSRFVQELNWKCYGGQVGEEVMTVGGGGGMEL